MGNQRKRERERGLEKEKGRFKLGRPSCVTRLGQAAATLCTACPRLFALRREGKNKKHTEKG
jgi:hypothetical protein